MNKSRQKGAGMIEVLVTVIITAVGLLGASAMQAKLQLSELESYQRAQAVMIMHDMANRMMANRNNVASYASTTTYGGTTACPTSDTTLLQRDLKEWCETLQGASETLSSSNVGAMIGGRGCIENVSPGTYMITVSWQGMSSTSAPQSSVSCGLNAYNDAAADCADDKCRRAVTTLVRVADL